MSWLLIIFIGLGDDRIPMRWALTPDRQTCIITGGAVSRFIETETPGLTARFACIREGAA